MKANTILKRNKRNLALVLSAIMMTGLTGCAQAAPKQTGEAKQAAEAEQAAKTEEEIQKKVDEMFTEEDADKAKAKAVITDENGVFVTDMEITINTPDTCSFDFTLNNPEGKDVTFDQKRITLKDPDGMELKPFLNDQKPVDASAQVERHSFNMPLQTLKGGEKVSVFFDGEKVAKLTVKGGPKEIDEDQVAKEAKEALKDIDIEEYTKMVMEQAKEGEKKYPVTLEVKESSKDVNPVDGGLFMTEDKVECRSIKFTNTDGIFSFGMELYNETGSDKTFDQTKFVFEKEKGVYVNPFVIDQIREPETVSGELKRLWMSYPIYDPKGLQTGDEVSVYYDGVFITKQAVEDFGQ